MKYFLKIINKSSRYLFRSPTGKVKDIDFSWMLFNHAYGTDRSCWSLNKCPVDFRLYDYNKSCFEFLDENFERIDLTEEDIFVELL